MAEAIREVFAPGKPGFIITLYVGLTIGEFIAEQLFRSTGRTDRIPFLKAGGGIASILILLIYIGLLVAKYNSWTTTGNF